MLIYEKNVKEILKSKSILRIDCLTRAIIQKILACSGQLTLIEKATQNI